MLRWLLRAAAVAAVLQGPAGSTGPAVSTQPDPVLTLALFSAPPPHCASLSVCEQAMASNCGAVAGTSRCSVCTGTAQHMLKAAGCTHADITWFCSRPHPTSVCTKQWLGGDCASTLKLPSQGPNATLWLFGDTLLGTMLNISGDTRTPAWRARSSRGCVMPHQSVGLQLEATERSISFTWKRSATTGEPISIFVPPHAGRPAGPTLSCADPFNDLQPYYWVVQGIDSSTMSREDPTLPAGKLFLLAVRTIGTPGVGLGFKVLGTTAIVVSNAAVDPTEWVYTTMDVTTCDDPATCETWATAIAPAPAADRSCMHCVYILGGLNQAGKQTVMRSSLSRLVQLDFNATEILCSDGAWRSRLPGALHWPYTAAALFPQQPSTTLHFSSYLRRWVAASTDGFAGQHIVLWSSEGEDVAGPWTGQQIYTLTPPWSASTHQSPPQRDSQGCL